MDSTKWPIPSGFDSTASTPSADINDGLILELYIVNIIIRTSGLVFFRINATSAPFKLGIDRSSRIKSGLSCPLFSMASTPSAASPQISIST
jgi:hypothetical protein